MYRKQKCRKDPNEDEKDNKTLTKAQKMTQRTKHVNSCEETKNRIK